MKKRAKKVTLIVVITVLIIIASLMNMRTIIDSTGLSRTARQVGTIDATVGDVLENYTFTSDTAGVGVAGSITDYSKVLKQIKLTAASANRVITLDLDDGYYTQINLDTTDVYDAGYDKGVEDTLKLDGPWGYDHETQTVSNGNLTFDIGDYIYYRSPSSSGYTGQWRLLGIDSKGQMLLVSEENVETQEFSGNTIGSLENAIEVLNLKCEKYADGTNTENGRSIRVEDINKITGYNPLNVGVNDPEQTGIGVPCYAGINHQYGNCVTYKVESSLLTKHEGHPINETEPPNIVHTWLAPPWEETKSIYVYASNNYLYYPKTLTESSTGDLIGIDTTSKSYNMLFNKRYWLASSLIDTRYNGVNYCLRAVVGSYVDAYQMWSTVPGSRTNSCGIRAVVTLKLSAKPVLDE